MSAHGERAGSYQEGTGGRRALAATAVTLGLAGGLLLLGPSAWAEDSPDGGTTTSAEPTTAPSDPGATEPAPDPTEPAPDPTEPAPDPTDEPTEKPTDEPTDEPTVDPDPGTDPPTDGGCGDVVPTDPGTDGDGTDGSTGTEPGTEPGTGDEPIEPVDGSTGEEPKEDPAGNEPDGATFDTPTDGTYDPCIAYASGGGGLPEGAVQKGTTTAGLPGVPSGLGTAAVELPRTGASLTLLALGGLGLVVLGSASVLVGRARVTS